jgi:hypothetical protein
MVGWLAVALALEAGPTPAGPASVSAPAAEGPCRLVVTTAQREAAVGEPFVVEARGEGPAGTSWSFPKEASSEDVELVATPVTSNGGKPGGVPDPLAQRYTVRVFALQGAEVPPLTASCRLADGRQHEVRSEPLAMRVRSLLPKDPQEQKLVDIRPPVSLRPGMAFWVALTGLVLLLTLAGFALWRRWRRRAVADGPLMAAEVPPDVEAQEALRRLEREGPLSRGDLRGHYIALTAIAKRYLERRLDAPVLEMTSTETVAFLRGHTHGPRLVSLMRDLVVAADQVKFAQGAAVVDEARRHTQAVLEVVTSLEEALRASARAPVEKGVA